MCIRDRLETRFARIISGDPGRVINQILDLRKYAFLLKSVFMVDVRFERTTNDPWSVDDAICERH